MSSHRICAFYMSAWQFAPAYQGKVHKRVILKHQDEYNDMRHNTFFTEVNIYVLRQPGSVPLYGLEVRFII